ncbi:MAG: UDP-N-acetylglucosamine--N-acetylmuramyl-(pentapeptide) pyrophosphoryl-undecaprenol [Thermoleophilaceae bacterium]|nr:UDP-N-acetylglucosamine--N-acetylmuramyl-(pentapeptide) pyrophosphoryl-undecaprenol [Thermoleophilaceae bacterium]
MAVAAELRKSGAEVSFLGTRDRMEADLVPAAGYEIDFLRVRGIDRRNPLRAARAGGEAIGGVGAARAVLKRRRADVVMGGGGYVAGPAGLAATLTRIPLVLTEADSHLGLANRLLAPFARRVCLAFPIPGRDGERYRVTGRPVPPPFTDRDAARTELGVGGDEACVLVFGGSLGARTVNLAAVEAFRDAPFRVLHAAGERDYDELVALLGTPPPANYDLRAYIDPFGPALAASDLVVARAGGSIFEIAAHGRPALLVPYPHATGDHQTANARWMAEGGAAVVVADGELTAERLAHEVGALLHDRTRLTTMANASAALARPAAAAEVAAELHRAAHR